VTTDEMLAAGVTLNAFTLLLHLVWHNTKPRRARKTSRG
jgi:hypothetical protein